MIRVLQDGPLDGPTNMARDEALLTCVGRSESPPTLRLYQWDPPTISLGYFQRYADYESLLPPAGTLPVVRRLTGGGAILHDLELTYSLALPRDHRLLSKGANHLYELAHDAVIACLASLGLSATRGTTTRLTPGANWGPTPPPPLSKGGMGGLSAWHGVGPTFQSVKQQTGKSVPHLQLGRDVSPVDDCAQACDTGTEPQAPARGVSPGACASGSDQRRRIAHGDIGTRPSMASPAAQPFFCFERRHTYDVLIGQDKIAGSAQRRRRDAILQHGSIILGGWHGQAKLGREFSGNARPNKLDRATQPLPFDEAVQLLRSQFVKHLAELTGEAFQPADWSAPELTAADELLAKYTGDKWTKRM